MKDNVIEYTKNYQVKGTTNNYKVYKHTTPNNKVYIGLTRTSTSHRWLNGKGYKDSKHFYNAIKKYGWDNIEHEILEDNLSLKQAIEKEQFYIKQYNSTNPEYGYNVSPGGYAVNDATRKKMSKNNKKKIKVIYIKRNNDDIEVGVCDSINQCKKATNKSESYIETKLKEHKYTVEECKKLSKHLDIVIESLLFKTSNKIEIYKYEPELLNYILCRWKHKDKIKKVTYYENVSPMSVDT